MIDEKELQQNVETEYFGQDQPDNGRTGNRMDRHGKEMRPLTLKELLQA